MVEDLGGVREVLGSTMAAVEPPRRFRHRLRRADLAAVSRRVVPVVAEAGGSNVTATVAHGGGRLTERFLRRRTGAFT